MREQTGKDNSSCLSSRIMLHCFPCASCICWSTESSFFFFFFYAACRMSSPELRVNWSVCWATDRLSRRSCSCCWLSSEESCWTKPESWRSFDCRWDGKTLLIVCFNKGHPCFMVWLRCLCYFLWIQMCASVCVCVCVLTRWWPLSGWSCSELRCSRRWKVRSERGSTSWRRSVRLSVVLWVLWDLSSISLLLNHIFFKNVQNLNLVVLNLAWHEGLSCLKMF